MCTSVPLENSGKTDFIGTPMTHITHIAASAAGTTLLVATCSSGTLLKDTLTVGVRQPSPTSHSKHFLFAPVLHLSGFKIAVDTLLQRFTLTELRFRVWVNDGPCCHGNPEPQISPPLFLRSGGGPVRCSSPPHIPKHRDTSWEWRSSCVGS